MRGEVRPLLLSLFWHLARINPKLGDCFTSCPFSMQVHHNEQVNAVEVVDGSNDLNNLIAEPYITAYFTATAVLF